MSKFYKVVKFIILLHVCIQTLSLKSQGNRLSIQIAGPKTLSICGLNDSAAIEVYNISSGQVNNLSIRLNLPGGINYVPGSVKGASVSESNISNLNQPVFSAPNLPLASNFRFRIQLKADCDLLTFLNNSNTPSIAARIDYTGNYDIGSSIPFSVNVPSLQFNTITNLTYTGDLGTKFSRTISFGNYGKGPLKELILKRINGKDVQIFYVSKGQTSYSGDTVITRFEAAYFKTIGNNDSLLDQNEVISLEDSLLIKACQRTTTMFELSWGCNGKNCQTSRNSGSVIISNKTPVITAIPKAVYPTCYANNTFKSELWLVNTGTMKAQTPRLAISQYYPYMYSSFDTGSIRIRVGSRTAWKKVAKDSVSDSYNQGYYGCVGLYPIGYFRIRFPDLLVGDTLFLSWDTKSCLPPDCSNTSIVINSWAYNVDYYDQCKNQKSIAWTWGKVYDQQYFSASNFTPTDLINNQTGEFRTYISSASLLNVSSSARYKVEIVLPNGLSHSLLKKDIYFMNPDLSSSWSPDSVKMYGDTLKAFFPHPVPFNLSGSELVYYLKADCSKSGSGGNQSIGLQIKYMPDPSCQSNKWITLSCQSTQLKIHCSSNCAGGLKFRNFSVQRISFGKPDNNNDGKPDSNGTLDSLNIREERCMTGDTLESVFTGIVKRSSSIINWQNLYAESKVSNGYYLDIASVQYKVWRRGVTLTINCSQIRYSKTVSGSDATYRFDLSTDSMQNCVSSRFRYNNDDSVELRVRYRVSRNPYGLVLNLNFNNLFYTSNISNPVNNNNKFQCDTFSGQMIMAGYYFTTCCNDVYQSNSCSQMGVNNYFYLGLGACCSNYGGNNYFPFEYRHFGRLKQVKYYVPAGFKYIYSQLGQYRTAGSGKTAFEYKDSLYSASTGNNPIVYDIAHLYTDSIGGKIVPSDDGFHGYYYAIIEPTCEAKQGNIYSRYDFIFEKMGILGPGYDTITSGFNEAIVFNQPVYKIAAASQTIYAAKDTAEWELIFSNYSSTFNNNNAWLSPDNSGAVKVVEIIDAGTGQKLPSSNDIFKIGNVAYNSTRKFIIRAIYNSCKRDSVIIYSGWNCQNYPKDFSSYTCLKEKTALYIEPQNTQFQVSISDSVSVADLCSEVPYQITIENTGATMAYNTKAILNLPIGMTVVTGSSYIRYPHQSSRTSIPSPVLKTGTSYEWNLSNINTLISKGFKGVSDTNSNKIIINFKIKTDCNYSSGNYIRAGASASIKCGDPVIVYPAISNPFNIKGVTRPYYTLLKIKSDSIFPCEKPSKVRVTIVNLGPGNTGSEDIYQALLPPGLSYDSTLYLKVRKALGDTAISIRSFNGAKEVEFGLASGIVPGDSIQFEYGFNADNSVLDCGPLDLYSQTAVKQEVTCVADMSKCKINVVTGNNLQNPPVLKGSFVFSDPMVSQLKNVNDSEELSLGFTISNTGFKSVSNKVFKYKIVYDQNQSGTADVNDLVLYTDTLIRTMGNGAKLNINKKFRLKAGASCALFLWLDSSSCSCNFSSLRFPVPALKNAGNDVSLCSGDTMIIGDIAVKGYKYQWTPTGELKTDTLSRIRAVYINNDTAGISRQFVLTTYRGYCASKDTVNVDIYKQPSVGIMQNDTGICEGERVSLRAVSKGGTGAHKYLWAPSAELSSHLLSQTLSKNKQSKTFKVTVTDAKNCSSEDSVRVNVHPKPVNNFVYSQACDGDSITLTDSTILTGDSIRFMKWTFLNIDTTNVLKLHVNPLGAMIFDVRHYSISIHGCSDTLFKKVYLNPLPIADFSFSNVCDGDSMRFQQNSKVTSGKIDSDQWFINGSNIYNGKNFAYKFPNADTFSVTLVSRTDKSCSDTISKDVEVYHRPSADMRIADVCSRDTVHASDQSTIVKGSITRHLWNINGVLTDSSKFWYLNTKDTVYELRYTVISDQSCRDSIIRQFTVHPNPTSAFISDTSCEGSYVQIRSVSAIKKGSIVSYRYDLSDGSQYISPDFKHLFADSGSYNIRLITSSDKGCHDSFDNKALVYPRIIPDFQFNDTCYGFTSRFYDKSDYSKTSRSRIVYHFNASDSSLNQDPFYMFSSPGKYRITQVLTSPDACVYDTFHDVEIHPLPDAVMKDSNNCFDNRFSFSSESSVSKGNILSTLWTFSDNTQSSGQYVVHDFPDSGTYKIKLLVITDKQCRDSLTRSVTAYPKVITDFEQENVCLGHLMNFRDKSFVSNAGILKYDWSFGDANTSTLKDPNHYYNNVGTYRVNLKIRTSYLCDYDTFRDVIVYPVPIAGFSLDPPGSNILEPDITISDQSSGADDVFYHLGNGRTSDSRSLIESYPDSGWYTIRQVISNQFGCTDSLSKRLYIDYLFKFYAPTSFSPNDDGSNDFYFPEGIGIQSYEMLIYNRWGQLIYKGENASKWDGKYGGELVMDGVYLAQFKVRDYKGRWHYIRAMVTVLN